MTARINGQALERELGRLGDGSARSGTAVGRVPDCGVARRPRRSNHVEAELIRLACADTNGLARRWRVVFGGIGRRTCPVRCCSGSWPTGSRPMRPAISIRPPSSCWTG